MVALEAPGSLTFAKLRNLRWLGMAASRAASARLHDADPVCISCGRAGGSRKATRRTDACRRARNPRDARNLHPSQLR